MNITRAFGCHL